MRKKLVCMLLALATVASMSVVASAQSLVTSTALTEKIFSQESAKSIQELPSMIKMLDAAKEEQPVCERIWYDEAGNKIEDSALLSQLQESIPNQTVCEYIWYDAAGNRIDDTELIAELWNSMSSRGSVGQSCCDNPSYTTYYYEQHIYAPPTPALCVFQRTEVVYCTNCLSTISRTLVAEYSHIHE